MINISIVLWCGSTKKIHVEVFQPEVRKASKQMQPGKFPKQKEKGA